MHALAGRAGAVFLAATDLPLLHPAFVAGLLDALPGYDAAVPVLGGHDQTLAAAYDAGVLRRASELLAAGRPRVAALLDGARVHRLGPADLDEPDSVRSVNTRAEYAELRALPQPLVTVVAAGRPAVQVEAATLGAAIGIAWPVDPPLARRRNRERRPPGRRSGSAARPRRRRRAAGRGRATPERRATRRSRSAPPARAAPAACGRAASGATRCGRRSRARARAGRRGR